MKIKFYCEPWNWCVGIFLDRKERALCIQPLPFIGIALVSTKPTKEEIAQQVAERLAPPDTLDVLIKELREFDQRNKKFSHQDYTP